MTEFRFLLLGSLEILTSQLIIERDKCDRVPLKCSTQLLQWV